MKNLEKLKLQELTINEKVNIDGGWLKTIVGSLMASTVYFYDHWDRIKEGYNRHD